MSVFWPFSKKTALALDYASSSWAHTQNTRNCQNNRLGQASLSQAESKAEAVVSKRATFLALWHQLHVLMIFTYH